jgi:hypothetical protein
MILSSLEGFYDEILFRDKLVHIRVSWYLMNDFGEIRQNNTKCDYEIVVIASQHGFESV